jgi:hypothetical protein
MQTFPNDPNGHVLRQMQTTGDNLEKPRDIDFEHIFEKEADARQFAEAVRRLGYKKVSIRFSEERNMWDVSIVVFMMPTHAETKLDTIAREFCGRADGWGCMAQE